MFLHDFFVFAYSHIREIGNENTQMNMNVEFVRRIPIAIPPIQEQVAISECLAHEIIRFNNLSKEANRVITLLQERRRALISAAVTGKIDVRQEVIGMNPDPKRDRRMHLWSMVDRLRGHISPSDFHGLIDALQSEGVELSFEDLLFLAQRFHGRTGGWVPPEALYSFFSRLVESREAMRVLDPMAGSGWLAAGVASGPGAARLTAVSNWQDAEWLAERFPIPRLSIVADDPADDGYDAVIAFPPINAPREERLSPTGKRVVDDPALLKLLDIADRVTEDGLIAWVTSPKFSFETRPTSVRRSLGQYGLHLTGLIQMPAGMMAPTTSIALEIAIIERKPREGLYVAVLPEG